MPLLPVILLSGGYLLAYRPDLIYVLEVNWYSDGELG
jgi:hypothetical protein